MKYRYHSSRDYEKKAKRFLYEMNNKIQLFDESKGGNQQENMTIARAYHCLSEAEFWCER